MTEQINKTMNEADLHIEEIYKREKFETNPKYKLDLMPESLKELIKNRVFARLDGIKIEGSKIPVEDALKFYELFPMHLYNLICYARWNESIECPACGNEFIVPDLSFISPDFPYYRCSNKEMLIGHRFHVFDDTVFQMHRFDVIPLIDWIRLIVFYINHKGKKEPTLKEMVDIIGTKNLSFFSRSYSAEMFLKVLKTSRKPSGFGKQYRIKTLGQLVKVLKWFLCFDAYGEPDLTKITSLLFKYSKHLNEDKQ